MKQRIYRKGEIRARADGQPGVTLHAITTNCVDDYGSFWQPDAFDESLERRLPTLVWSHDWNEPLGPADGFRTSDDGPDIDFLFSDFDAVPIARRAHAQVLDGTIRDCSVGFWNAQRRDPTDEERKQWPGIKEVIEKAELDEVSLVIRGAVPGALVAGVRSAAQVRQDAAEAFAAKVVAGEMTPEQAQVALDLLATSPDGEAAGEPTGAGDEGEQPSAEDIEAAQDAALAELEGVLADRSRL